MNESTSFEDRLLAVLEAEVAQGTAKQSAVEKRSGKRAVRIGVLVGAAVVAAVAAVGAPVVLGQHAGSAAWAVETRTDGSVEVKISELRDSAGLERRLAEAGIPAYVTFLPADKDCKQRTVRSDFDYFDKGLEPTERGFIVHPDRLGPNERLALTFALVDLGGAPGDYVHINIVPLNEERCTIVPHERADPAATPGR